MQIKIKFSRFKEVIAGVPQASLDEPLLFSSFINDHCLFLYFSVLSNYADDNNLRADIKLINQMILSNFRPVNNSFSSGFIIGFITDYNFTILNSGKCQFMSSGKGTHHDILR